MPGYKQQYKHNLITLKFCGIYGGFTSKPQSGREGHVRLGSGLTGLGEETLG